LNGDLQKVYDAIISNGNRLTALETKQELQHKENRDDIKEIKQYIRRTNMKNIGVIVTIVLAVLGTAVAWGSLQTKQVNNSERITEVKNRVKDIDNFTREQSNIITRQSVIQERTLKVLDRLEEKVYGDPRRFRIFNSI